MKKTFKKIGGVLVGLSPAALFAEGDAASTLATEVQGVVTPYITAGKTAIVAVLTAGVVIWGCFFLFRLIKRATNASSSNR